MLKECIERGQKQKERGDHLEQTPQLKSGVVCFVDEAWANKFSNASLRLCVLMCSEPFTRGRDRTSEDRCALPYWLQKHGP